MATQGWAHPPSSWFKSRLGLQSLSMTYSLMLLAAILPRRVQISSREIKVTVHLKSRRRSDFAKDSRVKLDQRHEKQQHSGPPGSQQRGMEKSLGRDLAPGGGTAECTARHEAGRQPRAHGRRAALARAPDQLGP